MISKINTNLAELFRNRVVNSPNNTAVKYDSKSFSWSELYALSFAVRKLILDEKDICRGDKIGIFIGHKPEQIISIFGISMVDCVFTIISPVLKDDQIKHQINDADLKIILTTEKDKEYLENLIINRGIKIISIELDKIFNKRLNDKQILNKKITNNIPKDVACIIYTSGSTGKPKGVVIPHKTLLDGARIVSGYLEITSKDIILSVLPLSFDYGLNQLLTVIYSGATIVLKQFNLPLDIVNLLIKEKITGFAGVPSMWWNFFNPKLIGENKKFDFPKLRYITTAGGKHPKELLDRLSKFFPETEIIIMYGLTESFRSTFLPSSELFKRIGSIGKAVPEVEILIINENGERCRPGEKGELIHGGAFINYGYLNNEELTNDKLIKISTGGRGCLPEIGVRSGDIVSTDEDGFIYFHERADMQIKSSGYRISPTQVEEAILLIPDIKHVAVFGVSEKKLGEMVVLTYSSFSNKKLDDKNILLNLKKELPSYMIPQKVFHFKDLFFTSNGKVDYNKLKKDVLNKLKDE